VSMPKSSPLGRPTTRRSLLVAGAGVLAVGLLSACGGAATVAATSATTVGAQPLSSLASTAASTATVASTSVVATTAAATASASTATATTSAASPTAAAKSVAAGTIQVQMLAQVGEAYPDLLKLVQQQLPKISVEFVQASDFMNKALAVAAAGTPPDFSQGNARYVPGMVEGKLLQDLGPLVSRGSFDVKDDAKPVLTDLSWKGKLYGLPMDLGFAYIAYNKDLFKQAGQTDPGTLWDGGKWTWDAFVSAAQALTSHQGSGAGVNGFQVNNWEGDYLSFVRSLGGDVLNADRTKFVLDSDAGIAALTDWASLVTKYKVSPPPADGNAPFEKVLVAMASSNPAVIVPFRKAQPTMAWDLVPYPTLPGGTTTPVLFSNGYSLWAGARQQQSAIDVMVALTTPAMMLEWAKRTGRTPTRSSLTADYARILNIPADPPPSFIKVATYLADKIEGLPLTPNYVDWQKILTTQVLTPVTKGQVSAADAVRNAAPAINALLAKA